MMENCKYAGLIPEVEVFMRGDEVRIWRLVLTVNWSPRKIALSGAMAWR